MPSSPSPSSVYGFNDRNRKRPSYTTILLDKCKTDCNKKECPITYYHISAAIKEFCMCRCHPHAPPPPREKDPKVGIGVIGIHGKKEGKRKKRDAISRL
jgi:hypothetical protein